MSWRGRVGASGTQAQLDQRVLHAAARPALNGRGAALALGACAAVLAAVVVAGAGLAPAAVDFTCTYAVPGAGHVLGTDWMGRDVAARVLAGLSLSLRIGVACALASSALAALLAAAAVLGGRWVDAAVSWLTDLVMGLPQLVLTLLISFALGRGAFGVTVAIALTHWTALCRVLRVEMEQVRSRPYTRVARQLGLGVVAVFTRHVAPGALRQFLIGLTLMVPHVILHEASLTFLGFGLSPDSASIGVMLAEALPHLATGAWWLAVFPGLGLLGVTSLCALMGSLALRLASREGVIA